MSRSTLQARSLDPRHEDLGLMVARRNPGRCLLWATSSLEAAKKRWEGWYQCSSSYVSDKWKKNSCFHCFHFIYFLGRAQFSVLHSLLLCQKITSMLLQDLVILDKASGPLLSSLRMEYVRRLSVTAPGRAVPSCFSRDALEKLTSRKKKKNWLSRKITKKK